MKIKNEKLKIAGSIIALVFAFTSCSQLQDSLSSEQNAKMTEETGTASIAGKTWYFDGISTTDFSSTTGASLAVDFSRKAAMAGTVTENDDGTDSYSYELSGSMAVNFTTPTGQSAVVTYKISEGKIILDSDSDPKVSVSAGEMSADGKTFRLNMTPVCYFLDAATAKGNSLDSVEVKLSGFVCNEGAQKGRAIASFSQKFSVKPFYEDEVVTEGVILSTIGSTSGKVITIPTNGSVTLTDNASVVFSSEDSDASSLTSSDFTLGTSEDGITISCSEDLKGKSFTGSFTISGFIPELNASSYTRTFTVNFSPVLITLDGVLDEEAWESAESSSESLANPSGYNLTEVAVTNDDENLYIAVKGDFSSFADDDRLVIMIDNTAVSSGGKASSDSAYNSYYGPATSTEFSGVDCFISDFIYKSQMQDYRWISDSGRTDVYASERTSSSGVIEYKIPLTVISNAAAGNILKVFVTATSYEWTTINEMTVKDCIPSSAATVSDGGQSVSIDFGNALSYTVKAGE
ncbi:MAG: hypothetical protein II821_08135 [Treponema sp.]|nr:hypothetical protein [Treponema sp.]